MNNGKRFFIILSLAVIVLSVFYVFLILKARFILADKLTTAFGRKVNIGQLNLKPPLNLELTDLEIENLVKIDYVYISPSIPNLLAGRFALNKVRVVGPVISCERQFSPVKQQDAEIPVVSAAAEEEKPKEPAQEKPQDNFRLVIKSLKVRDGEIYFTDHTSDSSSVMVVIKDININLVDIYTYPVNRPLRFNLSGRLPWKSGEPDGKVTIEGWMDFHKKSMLADLKIMNIDAIAFYPYYSTCVDLEKARIDKAKLNFTSRVKGENNDVAAQCHLELADIVRKPRPPAEPQQKAEKLTDAVLDMFKAMNQGQVVLDFTLRTKMDHPQFGFENIKSAFEGKLMQARNNAGLRPQDMLLFPGKMLQSGVRGGSDLTKAAVDGVFAIGNGLKKLFEDAMNRHHPVNELK